MSSYWDKLHDTIPPIVSTPPDPRTPVERPASLVEEVRILRERVAKLELRLETQERQMMAFIYDQLPLVIDEKLGERVQQGK